MTSRRDYVLALVYRLLRDEVPTGIMEQHIAEAEKGIGQECGYSEPNLAALATSFVDRLLGRMLDEREDNAPIHVTGPIPLCQVVGWERVMEEPGPKIPRRDEADLFYILDSRSIVGNCALWWRTGGYGYTTDLDDAETERRDGLWRFSRPHDVPMLKTAIDKMTMRHVSVDSLAFQQLKEDSRRERDLQRKSARGT